MNQTQFWTKKTTGHAKKRVIELFAFPSPFSNTSGLENYVKYHNSAAMHSFKKS